MAGENTDVVVAIDPAGMTETLYAMLHVDEGVAGEYEFPGPDGPVIVDGKPVSPAFTDTHFAAMSAPAEAAAPDMLPVTGGEVAETSLMSSSWLLLAVFVLLVLIAAGMYTWRRSKIGG